MIIQLESVFVEKRGIFTNPMKKGDSSTPGILFSYLKSDFKKDDLKKPEVQKRSRSADRKDDRFAFKPASLSLNAPFDPDAKVYGEDKKLIETLVENSLDV